ncbi:hypothetical protein ACQY0O_000210 [Thecaphora frezii]
MSDNSRDVPQQEAAARETKAPVQEPSKGPHTTALPAFAQGGRAVERAAALDREGHSEATAAAGGTKSGQVRPPHLHPGQDAA